MRYWRLTQRRRRKKLKELMLTLTAREKVGELSSKSKILNQIITGKDSYLILDTLPSEYYSSDIDGLDT